MKGKRLLSVMAFVLAIGPLSPPDALAQGWAFGFRGGTTISRLSQRTFPDRRRSNQRPNDVVGTYRWKSRTGYSASAVVIAPLIEMISFQFEPGVTRKGASRSPIDVLPRLPGQELSLTYLQLPLLFRWNSGSIFPGSIRPVAYLGPAISVLFSCRYATDAKDRFPAAPAGTAVACADLDPRREGFATGDIATQFARMEQFDLGAVVGLGLEIDVARTLRTVLDARFEHGAYSVDALFDDLRNQSWTFSFALLYVPAG